MTSANERMVKWSQKLLDFSARNRLLNIPARSRLVAELAIDDIAKAEDILAKSGGNLKAGDLAGTRASSRGASTADDVKGLESKLVTLMRQAKTDMEETGSNTLFLALGSLLWCERPDDQKAKMYRAPILLIPATLSRKSLAEGICLSRRDEEAVVNTTLVEFLRSQFSVEVAGIDPLPRDDSGIDLPKVLEAFREAVKTKPGWSVEETSHLGCFSFAKFVMWKDMTSRAAALAANPLVSHILGGGGDFDDGIAVWPPEDVARHVDPAKIFCPVSADSSQLAAVAYSGLGKTFVLHGPPGTGKSQTITNIIAHNLAIGKRVLFVSEKKAALDVVKRRLDNIGLSPFLLELHSGKSERGHFYAQLREALEVATQMEPAEWAQNAAKLQSLRTELDGYVREMHTPRANGFSAYDCIASRLSGDKDVIPIKANCLELAPDELASLCEDASKMATAYAATSPDAVVAFEKVKYFDWTPGRERGVKEELAKLASKPRLLRIVAARFSEVLDWRVFKDPLEAINAALAHIAEARGVMLYRAAAGRVAEKFGDAVALRVAQSGDEAPQVLRRAIAANTFDAILASSAMLASFAGTGREDAIRRLAECDAKARELAKKVVFARLAARLPLPGLGAVKRSDSSELGQVRRECAKKMRRKPVRQILAESRTIIPAMKPCFLMSPLSVAQYLAPDAQPFDLVVFDEASQMPVWDSIGVIARARQLVVVGDPKQMPPTSFFQKGDAASDDDAALDDDDETAIEDQESILDECLVAGVRSAYLTWHYRSRHESLISFSNKHYYSSSLSTFPAASASRRLGVKFHFVADGRFDRPKGARGSKVNELEARALVDYIASEVLRPDAGRRSIGVVAFSLAQRRLIESMIEERRAADKSLEAALPEDGEGAYFVKNLENVQGDEADVILFSVGYAPDNTGRMTMNFGPLNLAGGERRLNVAITRAKEQVVVFSSIRAADIAADGKAQGVADLKDFLAYAERASGTQDTPASSVSVKAPSGSPQPSLFPDVVARFLEENGYAVDRDVGESCFKIDIAVRNPEGGYLAAIECDGPNYANARTTEDRELNRSGVLASLGWKTVRVWSIDWACDRKRAEDRLLCALAPSAGQGGTSKQ